MFNSILKFFVNYSLITFLVIGIGLFGLGLFINSIINWTWLVYFFIIFKSLIAIIWFLPFDVIFYLLGLSFSLVVAFWSFKGVMLVYEWLRFKNL